MTQQTRLSKNDRLTVKVLDRRQFTTKAIYEVEYDGRKYHVPMFEFQKSLPLPQEIECVVQGVDGDSMYLVQNIAALLREHYTVGQTYEFVIAEDYTRASTPHYKLTDGTGFFFKLSPPKGVALAKNQHVRCRLRGLRNIDVDLEFISRVHQVNAGYNAATLVRRIGLDAVRLLNRYRRRAGVEEVRGMYDDGSPDWLPAGVEYVLDTLESITRPALTASHLADARALCAVMVWLMEDSDYFDCFGEADRRQRHERFRLDLRRAMAMAEAMDTILSGRGHSYVDRMLDKISASGYLIEAELKLRVIRNIFAIDRDLLSECIIRVIGVAVARRANCMGESAFRRAFVELLQIYVDSNCRQLDCMDEAETTAAREQATVMIRVLALQLLMADDSNDEFDYQLNRSRLYRYITLLNQGGEEVLFRKSLNALLACEQWRNEHGWKDMEQMLSLTTALRQDTSVASLPAVYDTAQAVVKVGMGSVTIESHSDSLYECDALRKLGLWRGLGISLDKQLPPDIRSPRTVQQYKRMWTEIERRLTMEEQAAPPAGSPALSSRLTVPVRGEVVQVKVTAADPQNPNRFRCVIVEHGRRGAGWIQKGEITSSDRDLPYSVFVGRDGQPYVFDAEVLTDDDPDNLQFSMKELINDYLNDGIRYDHEEECVILKKIGDDAMCLCRKGYVLNVHLGHQGEYLVKGDVILVNHVTVSPNGQWREGEMVRSLGGRIDFVDVMTHLMEDFALKDDPADQYGMAGEDPADDAPTDEAANQQEANRLDPAQVREVIRIIERVGATMRENRVAYNYFAYARMLALLIGDESLTDYYSKRCALLEELDVFFSSGRVDLSRLEMLMPDLMKVNSSLSTDVAKLRILSVLDHSDNNHRLWEIFGTDANESLQELARLVLAYNMLDGFKMRDERVAIRKKLYSRLKVDIDKEPTVVGGGIENLHTEFKTSTVFPANSMRIDVAAQTRVIMKVISAFMNTEGGTLYIGVSDEGYVRGLEYDLAFFGGRQDKFDRNIHDAIRNSMGFIPNMHLYLNTGWTSIDGKDIYFVKVAPLYEPVAVDGVYYYREGSSCVLVRPDDVNRFIESRRQLGISRGVASDLRDKSSADRTQAERGTAPAAQATTAAAQGRIRTSALRNNVLHDGYEGYQPVSAYLYVYDSLDFDYVDHDRWMEDSTAVTVGLHSADLDRDLLVVSADGYVARMPVSSLRDSDHRFSPRLKPLLVTPADDNDSLLTVYRDSSGQYYKKLFKVADIRMCKVAERGEHLHRDIAQIVHCECVGAEGADTLRTLVRKQRVGKDEDYVRRDWDATLARVSGAAPDAI